MDRRAFLITSGGAAVAAASTTASQAADSHGVPQPPLATSGQLLRLSMPWADTPQGPADQVRRLARRFEIMTEGRYRIDIAPNTATGTDADIAFGSAHDFAHLHPAFAYFAGLPGSGGLEGADFAHWLTVGGGQMLWDDLAAKHGWKPLAVGHTGEAPPLWSRMPITSLNDLAGQRVAAFGLGADVARALGAEGFGLQHSLKSGLLADDSLFAVETGGLLASLASGVARNASYATGSGLNGHGTALSLGVRLAVWDSLTEADKAIFEAVAAEAYQAALADARAHDRLARGVLERSFGVNFSAWPTDLAEALDRVAEATVAHVAGHDAAAARIDQSYMAFRGAISGAAGPRRVSGSGPVA